ncbi:MAG: DoxX family membrane protein [Leadbetterella sp.]|nr:DoxX family membrane protein [Leadbetterella sp.]
MKILANFSRVIVGMYLIFSGFLKVVDPYGTALKLKEYFEVFAMDLPVLEGFFGGLGASSVTLSVIFCCLELVIGVALLFGFKLKWTAWVALLLMTFFTFLTFYSAYFNRVTDCGCFGEFMKLKPWTSFWKNVVTMVFIVILFVYRKKFSNTPAEHPPYCWLPSFPSVSPSTA